MKAGLGLRFVFAFAGLAFAFAAGLAFALALGFAFALAFAFFFAIGLFN
jgi:hypothetical protein